MRARRLALWAVLAVYFVIAAYPLVWVVFSGLRTEQAVRTHVWSAPTQPTAANLGAALASGGFLRAYLNSAVVAVAAGLLAAMAAAMAGFAFARWRSRWSAALFTVFLLGMMIPPHVTLIPLTRLLQALHLRSTYLALIGPYVGFALPVSIFILRGFFAQAPRELEEAAELDGCSTWGVFWHVALPLARPALATVVIFNFVAMWNEFVFALTFLRGSSLRTLPLALYEFSDQAGMYISRVCAALSIAIVPLLLVYFVAQRWIIRGLTAGALKE